MNLFPKYYCSQKYGALVVLVEVVPWYTENLLLLY